MNHSNIYIHIGMPRTGSTFLQKEIFSKIIDINYRFIQCKEFFSSTFYDDFMKYEYVENIPIIISNENIYCDMWSKIDLRFSRLESIVSMFNDCKIIIGVREKSGLLCSWYKKYILSGGVLDFEAFKNSINVDKVDFFKEYREVLFKYFNKDNVFVYDFEKFKSHKVETIIDICKFIKCKYPHFEDNYHNVGYNSRYIKFARFCNKFFKTRFNPYGIVRLNSDILPHKILYQNSILCG